MPKSRYYAFVCKNVDSKHQQVHCCLSPRWLRTNWSPVQRGERWLSLGRHSTRDDDLFCEVSRISCFQKHRVATLRQPHSTKQTWRLPELADAMQHVARLKQLSAVPQSMHSEPLASTNANGQDVHRTTEQLLQVRIDSALLHVRLNKVLSWSLRSKRLRLKKKTPNTALPNPMYSTSELIHGQDTNQNRHLKNADIQSRQLLPVFFFSYQT